MTTLREAAQQALEALQAYGSHAPSCDHLVLLTSLPPQRKPCSCGLSANITALRAALAAPTVKESLQIPAEVAATLTTTDIAWLETRRLTRLWKELGQMRWAGADEGWDRAIEAVRSRLNDECQSVLDWKAKADQSQATAIQLLRKMQGVNDD